MISKSRTRTRGGYTLQVADLVLSQTSGPATTHSYTYANDGTKEIMNDIVIRPFVPGQTIVNSPMNSSSITYSCSPANGSQAHNGPSGYNRMTGDIFINRDAVLDALIDTYKPDTNPLLTQAATRALANVRKPEVAGLVALAELRSTVASLLNPVNGALRWLARNAPTKKKRKRRSKRQELKDSLKDASNQHLTIIFGLMPFISDIQGILKAIETFNPDPERFTARGEASAHSFHEVSSTPTELDGANKKQYQYHDTVNVTVSVRAYQLYEASVELQNNLGLSLSDVPKAGWQLVPLSFVADWFANVGDFISALTPQSGIHYLSSGYTITTVTAGQSDYSWTVTYTGPWGWTGSFANGTHTRVTVAKSRVPTGLFPLIGLAFKRNMHRDVLDTFKITAGISLITQRIAKFL